MLGDPKVESMIDFHRKLYGVFGLGGVLGVVGGMMEGGREI